ncbi:phosphate ABC transporter permease PstA [Nocardioides sp. CER19]|uniref:phosphate ABC transporter permease PstA n=1 Tax=Nocardioides sp. CER19 TaxID=3038538 RepID=UPI00244A045F|nr:phosphate ABC transporter permease PstA [Nocardioides sp. CER19]MDH2414840.1 phosphate ABC transporter permease PstA [Nocardioides sp. CER19]
MTVSAPVTEATDDPQPRTHLPASGQETPAPVPRAGLGAMPEQDRLVIWGSRLSAAALAWVITQRLLPTPGPAWFLVVFGAMNLLVLSVTTALTDDLVVVKDRIAQWLVSTGALVVFSALASTIFFVFHRGWHPLVHLNFYIHDMTGVGPSDPLDKGGILHAIVGSLIEIGIAVAITLPLGVGTAVFMTEVGGRFARVVRTVVEAMTALPSIVAGLFIYTTLIIALGVPRSGLAAGLAISVMMLPIIARASDVVLRVVPGGLREASLALGASRWKTVWHVVLPTARPGLATALILGIARGIGETSPVLITSGAAAFLVTDPSQGVMNSLPLYIFSTVRSGVPIAIERAFATASVLLILVLVLFVVARLLARPRK